MRALLVSVNREQLPSPVVPLGLLYVATSVRKRHDVVLVDLCFEDEPLEVLRTKIRELAPDVVGIGIRNLHTNTYAADDAEVVLEWLDRVVATVRESTQAPLVAGGSGFSLQPALLIERLGLDWGVVGEGEETLLALLDAIEAGEQAQVPKMVGAGLWPSERGGAGGASVPQSRLVRASASRPTLPRSSGSSTQPAPALQLDALEVPDRSLADPRYLRWDGTDNLQTKRGCAFLCDYCSYPDIEGRKVRVRDPKRVAEEFADRARAPDVRHLFVVDSVFNVPRSHAIEVCRHVVATGVQVPWTCYVTPAGFDDEVAQWMRRAGCVGVEIGSDSGTDRMLRTMKKPFDTERIRRADAALKNADIADCHTFVLGTHDETPEEAMETLRFVDSLDPSVAVFMVYMEDRESRTQSGALHRRALLDLLAREAPKRPAWVVPELKLRFHQDLMTVLHRMRWSGPSWLYLAQRHRGTLGRALP